MTTPQQVEVEPGVIQYKDPNWPKPDPPGRYDDTNRRGKRLVCADCGPDRCECGGSSGGVWV